MTHITHDGNLRNFRKEVPTRSDAHDNRGKLLAACRDAIAAEGIAGATIKEITTRAELSPATFFRHFKSKSAAIDEISVSRWSLLELHARRSRYQDHRLASYLQIISILELFTRMVSSDDNFIAAAGLRVGHTPESILPIRAVFEPHFANLWVDAQRHDNILSSAHPRDAVEMAANIRNRHRRIPMLATLINGISTDAVDVETLITELFVRPNRGLPLRHL